MQSLILQVCVHTKVILFLSFNDLIHDYIKDFMFWFNFPHINAYQ
jgi:hypothetical protein